MYYSAERFPEVNAEIENNDVIYKNFYNIGVAVGTDQGLVVPVVKDADKKSLVEVEKEIYQLGQKARSGQLSIEDMQGGTFTISNGCLLYTSPSPRDMRRSRMPSSA